MDGSQSIPDTNISQSSMNILLARIDERTATLSRDVEEIKRTIASNYVTRQEFQPVRAIAYGLVAIISTGVVVGLIALLLRTPQ